MILLTCELRLGIQLKLVVLVQHLLEVAAARTNDGIEPGQRAVGHYPQTPSLCRSRHLPQTPALRNAALLNPGEARGPA